jgi:zinc transport system substrate-binding protein
MENRMLTKIGIVAVVAAALSSAAYIGYLRRAPVPTPRLVLQVSASFYPLYFFAQEIAGPAADVVLITPAGAEPHEYEPTAQDIVRIEKSGLVILNGAGLEPWAKNLTDSIRKEKTAFVSVADALADRTMIEEGESVRDPHVWLNPVLAKKVVDHILDGFIQADPANRSLYEANAARLNDKLDALDRSFAAGLSRCATRDIITSHAAFSYMAGQYDLNQVPIAGLSPDAEPSPAELASVADFAKKAQAKYIFFESLVSPKLAQTIAQEVGAQTLVLNPLEGLTADDIKAGKNYFTEMQQNLVNLRTALACM